MLNESDREEDSGVKQTSDLFRKKGDDTEEYDVQSDVSI